MKKTALQTLLPGARQRSQLRPHRLFEDGLEGRYRISVWGQFLKVDSNLAEMLGYPDRKSLMAVNIRRMYVDAHEFLRWQFLMARGGVLQHVEATMRRRDGSTIRVRNSARAIRGDDGAVICFEGSLDEIDQAKRDFSVPHATVEV